MWLNKLKIALIEKNLDNLAALMEDIPQLSGKKEMEEALYLIKSATELVESLKEETATSMKKMKKNINFLKATQAPVMGRLDIKS